MNIRLTSKSNDEQVTEIKNKNEKIVIFGILMKKQM